MIVETARAVAGGHASVRLLDGLRPTGTSPSLAGSVLVAAAPATCPAREPGGTEVLAEPLDG